MNRYAKHIKDSQAGNFSGHKLGKDLTMTLEVLGDTAVLQFCHLHSDILQSIDPGKQHS